MKKIVTLFYCIVYITSIVSAQTFTEKLTTTSGAFDPYKIIPSKKGGVYIAGSANIIQGAIDEAYVAELNSSGKLLCGINHFIIVTELKCIASWN